MARIRCDFRSETLDMGTSITVFLPESKRGADAQVVYLLHGLSDNCTGWSRYTSVERYARKYDVAVVMPEVQRSFYMDMANGLNYFTFVHDELPTLCNRMFNFSQATEANYIMGLSMGGYGSLKCALNTPDRYAGVAAFSAVTDIAVEVRNAESPRHREYVAMFGPNLEVRPDSDLYALLKKQQGTKLPRMYAACGEQDRLLTQNIAFYQEVQASGCDCLFERWEGIHNWEFWDAAVKKAFDYFFADR